MEKTKETMNNWIQKYSEEEKHEKLHKINELL